MRKTLKMIIQAQQVESLFGYWPEFADGHIEHFSYERRRTIIMGIFYIDADQGKEAMVTLKFSGVGDIELTDFLTENVIDALHISASSPVAVEIEACHGLCGTFTCEAVEVLSVQPNMPLQPTSGAGPTSGSDEL